MKYFAFTLALILFTAIEACSQARTAEKIISVPFSQLGATGVPDSSVRYCFNCAATAPCTSGGSGAFALRVGGVWNCSDNTASGSGGTWGTIIGVIANQSDLQAALSALQSGINARQPIDVDLTAIANLSPPDDDFIQRKGGEWVNRSPANVKVDLQLDAVNNTSDAAKNAAVATLTNKTMSGASNTFTNLPASGITGVIPIANLATGTPDGTKFIRDDGTLQVIPGGGDALVANPLSQFAATTSAQLAGVINNETGSSLLVFNTSPTLVTPILGVATATSINKVAITTPATSATLTIADGKTLTASNSLILEGTDASSVEFGTGGTVAYTGDNLSAFAATTSAELAGVLSNETGTNLAVFNTEPLLVGPIISNNATLPTAALGKLAVDTDDSKLYYASDGSTWGEVMVSGISLVNLSAGVTDVLPVANGGTGLATLTANNVILGNGTSDVLFVAPGASGNVLTSNGTTWESSAAAGGGGTWGSITGTLGDQTDLNTALGLKATTALDNLASVAINVPLKFGAAATSIDGSTNNVLSIIGNTSTDHQRLTLGPADASHSAIRSNAQNEVEAVLGDASAMTYFSGLGIKADNDTIHLARSIGVSFGSTVGVRFNSSSALTSGAIDTGLFRSAAGMLEVNSASIGTFRDLKVRKHFVDQTITGGGTTGAQTIDKAAGTVNFAAAATSLVVTNSLVTTSSTIYAVKRTNDATCQIQSVVPAAGSFEIFMSAGCGAETSVGFLVIN